MRRAEWVPPLFFWIIFASASAGALWYYTLRPFSYAIPLSVLAGINLSTFLLYGWDKFAANTSFRRVPEVVLYTITFLGGPAGALLGMNVFRHKTRKTSFQFVVALLLLLQMALILGYLRYYGEITPSVHGLFLRA